MKAGSSSSTTAAAHSINNQNLIVAHENKIRTLLKELQTYVKRCQEARVASEPNLENALKAQEKMKKEDKALSTFGRKKLKGLLTQCTKDSENEVKALRDALDCINQVRIAQTEIRLLQAQQQNASLSSPSVLLNQSPTRMSAMLNHSPNSIYSHHNHNGTNLMDTLDSVNSSSLGGLGLLRKGPNTTMRRGVLMSILQQAALTLPLWIGDIGQTAPPLCGSISPGSSYLCKPGDKVAAIVKNNNAFVDKNNEDSQATLMGDEEENWILAEVVAYHINTGKYEVDDVDAEEGQERHTLARKRVVPLPLWRANPMTDPEAIFPKDSCVLALYPQTTCFYRGIVSEPPQTPQEDYLILFEDNTYPEGYSPPLNVPQLYVVNCHEKFKK